jgi:hypothetical protein
VNILKCKKYEWTVNKKFTVQAGERVKEAIIDTFVRTRLKEGFKCIFQSSKFVVFMMQIYMYDDVCRRKGEPATCSSQQQQQTSAAAAASSKKEKSKPDEHSKMNASPQTCTFFYVIYFHTESSSPSSSLPSAASSMGGHFATTATTTDKTTSRNLFNSKSKLTTSRFSGGGESLLKQTSGAAVGGLPGSKEEEYVNGGAGEKKLVIENCFFRTELYFEDVEGVNKQSSIFKTAARETNNDYFKKLTNTEIVNLIHLIDLKAFLSLQSVYSLFLSKPDFLNNISAFRNYSKVDLENLCADSTLVKVQDYDAEFFDSVRLLPDLSILFRRNSFKLSRLDFTKSSQTANLHNRIDFRTKRTVNLIKKSKY